MNKKLFFFLNILIFSNMFIWAAEVETILPFENNLCISSNWIYHIGNSSTYGKHIDNSQFSQPITLIGTGLTRFKTIKRAKSPVYILSIKKNLILDSSLSNENIYLSLDKHMAPLECYINGTLFYKHGYYKNPGYFSYSQRAIKIGLIPNNLINYGSDNELLIKFFNDSNKILQPKVCLQTQEYAYGRKEILDFLNSHLYVGFFILAFFVGFYFLLQFFLDRSYIYNLHFALANILYLFIFLEWEVGSK